MRYSIIERKTAETDIVLELDLDGSGKSEIDTGIGFLDHMLTLFSHHGSFDLKVLCRGDINVDYHHSTEDIGICLGEAFSEALGDMRGICRYGDIILPMDETLIMASCDFSGRSFLGFLCDMPTEKVGDFDTELCEEFFYAFVRRAECALHIRKMAGSNSHHIIEGVFKAVSRALSAACRIDEKQKDLIPSTKGVLK